MNTVDPGLIALLILAPIILSIIVLFYIAHKYTEHFESLLPNCTYVTGNKKIFQHAGLLGKVMLYQRPRLINGLVGEQKRRGFR